jgi:hypothetical protein
LRSLKACVKKLLHFQPSNGVDYSAACRPARTSTTLVECYYFIAPRRALKCIRTFPVNLLDTAKTFKLPRKITLKCRAATQCWSQSLDRADGAHLHWKKSVGLPNAPLESRQLIGEPRKRVGFMANRRGVHAECRARRRF